MNFMKSNVKYLVVFILALVLLVVFVSGGLVGGESYFNARYDGSGYDSLSFGGRSVDFPVGFAILAGFFGLKFFPVFLGILSLVLVFFYFERVEG